MSLIYLKGGDYVYWILNYELLNKRMSQMLATYSSGYPLTSWHVDHWIGRLIFSFNYLTFVSYLSYRMDETIVKLKIVKMDWEEKTCQFLQICAGYTVPYILVQKSALKITGWLVHRLGYWLCNWLIMIYLLNN